MSSSLEAAYATLPPYRPYIQQAVLPHLAFILLFATFTLGFYFTILPKNTLPTSNVAVASVASTLAGFGLVSLFCAVGVNV